MIPQHMATHLDYGTLAVDVTSKSVLLHPYNQLSDMKMSVRDGRLGSFGCELDCAIAAARPDISPCLSPSVGLGKPYLPDHQRWLEWAFCELGLMY